MVILRQKTTDLHLLLTEARDEMRKGEGTAIVSSLIDTMRTARQVFHEGLHCKANKEIAKQGVIQSLPA